MVKVLEMVKGAAKGKARLWLEYALIAGLLILAGVAAFNYVTRLKLDTRVATLEGKVTTAENRVKLVEEVNEQQKQALETIQGLNSVNDTMLAGLAADMEALRVRDRSAFDRLAALEKSNEAVRKYLNTVVPAPVGCLLDRTCADADGNGLPATQRGSATPVPGTQARPK